MGNQLLVPYALYAFSIYIHSVLDPENPEYVKSWGISTADGSLVMNLRDIGLAGITLCVASEDQGLIVYDMADPLQPVLLGSHSGLTGATGVEVVPPHAYLITATGELKVVRIQP